MVRRLQLQLHRVHDSEIHGLSSVFLDVDRTEEEAIQFSSERSDRTHESATECSVVENLR